MTVLPLSSHCPTFSFDHCGTLPDLFKVTQLVGGEGMRDLLSLNFQPLSLFQPTIEIPNNRLIIAQRSQM